MAQSGYSTFVPIGDRLFVFPRTEAIGGPYQAFELDLKRGLRIPVTTPYRVQCRSSSGERWFVENVDTRWLGHAKLELVRL